MSAFITRRGGASSGGASSGGGNSEIITGTANPTSGGTMLIIPDLIGKSRFVIDAAPPSSGGIICVCYADGAIRQQYKGTSTTSTNTAAAGTDKSAAYFDPTTGTINVSVLHASRIFHVSTTCTYTIFG